MAKSSAARIRDSRTAKPSVKERFRGSSDLPLTPEGVAAVTALAKEIAEKGGLDVIYTPRLQRNRRTAEILAKYTRAKVIFDDDLVDWRMGGLEGQPVDAKHIAIQNDYILKTPDKAIPGRGPISTKPGESFNTFETRATKKTDEIIARARDTKGKKIAYVVNFRFIKLAREIARANGSEIDKENLVKYLKSNDMKPASVERVSVDGDNLEMASIDVFSVPKLEGDSFLIRHGHTPWNKPDGDTKDDDE